MSNSACRCRYEIIKSFTSIKVFFKPRDLDKGVQPIILVRARFFDYRERRNKRYLAFSLGGLWASGRLSSIFFTHSNSGSRSYFPLPLALSTRDETTAALSYCRFSDRLPMRPRSIFFTSPDNFIKRCAFGNVINIPTVCSRGFFGARTRYVRKLSRMVATYGPGFCIWGGCPSFPASAVALFKLVSLKYHPTILSRFFSVR